MMIPQEPSDMTAKMPKITSVVISDCVSIWTKGTELFKITSRYRNRIVTCCLATIYKKSSGRNYRRDEIKAEIGFKTRSRNFVYNTPLLLGTPFTLRLGAIAMATARANALKMLSRQWWLSLP